MRKIQSILAAATLLPIGANAATVVTLLPSDINGGVTTTESFSNAAVTITPTIVGSTTPVTFNADAVRLGIDGNGTNANAFNDPDATVGNAGEEGFTLQFAANSGLTGFAWDFSRFNTGTDANGNTVGGLLISGFTANPMAVLSGAVGAGTAVFDATSGSLRIGGVPFGGPDTILTLDVDASLGQLLTVNVNDPNQAGAQLALLSVTVETVPEPSSALLLGLVGFGALLRRRR